MSTLKGMAIGALVAGPIGTVVGGVIGHSKATKKADAGNEANALNLPTEENRSKDNLEGMYGKDAGNNLQTVA